MGHGLTVGVLAVVVAALSIVSPYLITVVPLPHPPDVARINLTDPTYDIADIQAP